MTDYCTTSDVAAVLEITGSTYNTNLARIVTAASRWIDHHCKLPDNGLAQSTPATRYYAETRNGLLRLDAPLISVTGIVNGDGSVIDVAQAVLWPRNGEWHGAIMLKSTAAWRWATDGEIAVTGLWGKAAVCPADVREACVILAAWIFKRYQAGLQDVTATGELGQLSYAKGMPEQVETLLRNYVWTVI